MAAVSERPIPTGEGLTFEKVWVMFQESDRKMREIAERQEKRQQEIDRQMKETEKFLNSIGKQIGGLNRSFGELAEHLVLPGLLERFKKAGYSFNAVISRGFKVYDDANEKILTEVDMLLMNGNCLMAVEVKAL